jgi:hypothetical protein
MGVGKLVLNPEIGHEIEVTHDGKEFEFDLGPHERSHVWLDRTQAHMLLLYLKEHLSK